MLSDTLLTRYHKDSGFPKGIELPQPGMLLKYSPHAIDKAIARTDVDLLPMRLPSTFEVIEVSTFAGKAAHWVVRFPLMRVAQGTNVDETRTLGWYSAQRTEHDVVMALGTGLTDPLTVRTVYLNHKDDKHATLRKGRYQEVK